MPNISLRSYKPSCAHFTKAFTLVELLIVIAVIALLLSLMTPALEQSRAAARSLKCSANVRQLYMGLDTYAREGRDYVPTANNNNAGGAANTSWQCKIGDTGAIGPVVSYSGFDTAGNAIQLKSWSPLSCPDEEKSAMQQPTSGVPAAGFYLQTFYRTSYGLNASFNNRPYSSLYAGWLRAGWSKGPQSDMIRGRFSDAPIIMDGLELDGLSMAHFINEGQIIGAPLTVARRLAPYRHPNQTANVLYWDGHAISRRAAGYTGINVYAQLYNTNDFPTGGLPPSAKFN